MKRCEREALVAAHAVFAAAAWEIIGPERGGKHTVLVVRAPSGATIRFPVSGSPSRGVTGAVKMAQWTAKRAILQDAEKTAVQAPRGSALPSIPASPPIGPTGHPWGSQGHPNDGDAA